MTKNSRDNRRPLFIRLPPRADAAIDAHAASIGGTTRSAAIEALVERFLADVRASGFDFKRHPVNGPCVTRKFLVTRRTYDLLEQVRREHGLSFQDLVRGAIEHIMRNHEPVPEPDPPSVPSDRKPGPGRTSRRRHISLAVDVELLAQIDAIAARTGQSRTALIARALRCFAAQDEQEL